MSTKEASAAGAASDRPAAPSVASRIASPAINTSAPNTFVGVERITGVVAGRAGTLVLQHVGSFTDGAATAQPTVVGGACAGDLAGASGDGDFLADPAGTISLELTLR